MKLLIISDMAHYLHDGALVGWGPTVEEINHLAMLFDEVRHIGCLHTTAAPGSSLPYSQPNITFIPLPPTGGNHFRDKLKILQLTPRYLATIWKELNTADVVHLRCPANIPLLALLVMVLRRKPKYRWVKYAGNWGAGREYPVFFRLQRWILNRNLTRSIVTINGSWTGQKPHILSFQNPCLTEKEVDLAQVSSLGKVIQEPVRLVFVGALNERKGVNSLLSIASSLQRRAIPFVLDILGDGADRTKYENQVAKQGLSGKVVFHGWVPKPGLAGYYQQAHINLLPSQSEGWPKVLSEGMAYGVVPLASAVASIPQVLTETGAGLTISPHDNIEAYVDAVKHLLDNPHTWHELSVNSRNAAVLFTYENYLRSVRELFARSWEIKLPLAEK